jgi:hypothetical protein
MLSRLPPRPGAGGASTTQLPRPPRSSRRRARARAHAPARPRARAPARSRAACCRVEREATGPGLGREGDGHDHRPAPRAPRCPRSCGRGLRRGLSGGLMRRTRSRTESIFGRTCTRSLTTFYSTRCAPHPRARRAPRTAHRKSKREKHFEKGPMERYAAMRRPSRGQEAAVSLPSRDRRSEKGKGGFIARTPLHGRAERKRRGAGVLQPAAPARGPALQGVAVWETRRQARKAR